MDPDYKRVSRDISAAKAAGDAARLPAGAEAPATDDADRGLGDDPNYRRLYYVRYADDFILGFAGPRREAAEIKEKLRDFLATQLHLTLSAEEKPSGHPRPHRGRPCSWDTRSASCRTTTA